MFCYQCEQTAKNEGCTKIGVCGKDPTTAALQDLLVHALKGMSKYMHKANQMGKRDREIDIFTIESLFSTLTNVNFDPERFKDLLIKAGEMSDRAEKLYKEAMKEAGKEPEDMGRMPQCTPETSVSDLVEQGEKVSVEKSIEKLGEDKAGLQELIVYGLKGLSAYLDHARILGKEDENIFADIYETLDFLTFEDPPVDELLAAALKVGEINLRAMEILDAANTETYGHPEPTQVRIHPKGGKAIVVSGHDLKDLEELLKQTEGKGINVYTHGEMLPANAYPGLKKYEHLAGNYGGAWQDQKKEFDEFPGAILMTTNCIQKPKDTYHDRIFTSNVTGWPGVTHIEDRDFGPVIEAALSAPGFEEDGPNDTITVGFGRNAVLGAAEKVVGLVKEGKIKHFFLIGGCDGAKSGRNYYTEFAKAVPEDSVILTLACGKYRFNKLDFGDIEGIPRLLDVGQCNDAYSAIKIATALADAFETDVNSLPLSMILSWYEQKAVAILLTLLHLGIKDIKLGPTLPAFLTPPVIDVLVDKFNIAPTGEVDDDLKMALG